MPTSRARVPYCRAKGSRKGSEAESIKLFCQPCKKVVDSLRRVCPYDFANKANPNGDTNMITFAICTAFATVACAALLLYAGHVASKADAPAIAVINACIARREALEAKLAQAG